MKVVFMPLGGPRGRKPIVVRSLPVTLTRAHRESFCLDACTVSESHCEIREENGLLVVEDLGSRHGTFVNGTRVRRCYLWPGDALTVGTNSYLVGFDLSRHDHRIRNLAKESPNGLPSWPRKTVDNLSPFQVTATASPT